MITCDFCGATAEGDTPPLTWALSVENGRTKLFCPDCSRANVRAMESKLDSAWW